MPSPESPAADPPPLSASSTTAATPSTRASIRPSTERRLDDGPRRVGDHQPRGLQRPHLGPDGLQRRRAPPSARPVSAVARACSARAPPDRPGPRSPSSTSTPAPRTGTTSATSTASTTRSGSRSRTAAASRPNTCSTTPLTNCPAELRTGGYCLSPCTRYNTDQFCCRGAYGTQATCVVANWAALRPDLREQHPQRLPAAVRLRVRRGQSALCRPARPEPTTRSRSARAVAGRWRRWRRRNGAASTRAPGTTVVNQGNGKCVDDDAWGTTNGARGHPVALRHQQFNQQWQFQPTDSGYYRVMVRHATWLGLDVTGGPGATGNGAKIQLWGVGSPPGTNQQWRPWRSATASSVRGAPQREVPRRAWPVDDERCAAPAVGLQRHASPRPGGWPSSPSPLSPSTWGRLRGQAHRLELVARARAQHDLSALESERHAIVPGVDRARAGSDVRDAGGRLLPWVVLRGRASRDEEHPLPAGDEGGWRRQRLGGAAVEVDRPAGSPSVEGENESVAKDCESADRAGCGHAGPRRQGPPSPVDERDRRAVGHGDESAARGEGRDRLGPRALVGRLRPVGIRDGEQRPVPRDDDRDVARDMACVGNRDDGSVREGAEQHRLAARDGEPAIGRIAQEELRGAGQRGHRPAPVLALQIEVPVHERAARVQRDEARAPGKPHRDDRCGMRRAAARHERRDRVPGGGDGEAREAEEAEHTLRVARHAWKRFFPARRTTRRLPGRTSSPRRPRSRRRLPRSSRRAPPARRSSSGSSAPARRGRWWRRWPRPRSAAPRRRPGSGVRPPWSRFQTRAARCPRGRAGWSARAAHGSAHSGGSGGSGRTTGWSTSSPTTMTTSTFPPGSTSHTHWLPTRVVPRVPSMNHVAR